MNLPPRRRMVTPRAACGVTPQGAALAARQSRFRGALGWLPLSSRAVL